jgi:hypothetical protein
VKERAFFFRFWVSAARDRRWGARRGCGLLLPPAPAPTDEEIARINPAIARRAWKLFVRKGLLGEEGPTDRDPTGKDEPLLSQLYSASAQGRVAAELPARQAHP